MYTDLNEQMDLNVPFEQFKQADESASYEQQKRKRKPRPSAYEKINQQLRQLDKTTNICSSAIVCNSAVDTFRASLDLSIQPLTSIVHELCELISAQNKKLDKNYNEQLTKLPEKLTKAIDTGNRFLRSTQSAIGAGTLNHPATARSQQQDEQALLSINGFDLKTVSVSNSLSGTGRNIVRRIYGDDGSGYDLKPGEFEIILDAIAYLHRIPLTDVWCKTKSIQDSLMQMKYDRLKHTLKKKIASTSANNTEDNEVENQTRDTESLFINGINLLDAPVTHSLSGTGRNILRHIYGHEASGFDMKDGDLELILKAIAYLHHITIEEVLTIEKSIKESLQQMKYDNKKLQRQKTSNKRKSSTPNKKRLNSQQQTTVKRKTARNKKKRNTTDCEEDDE